MRLINAPHPREADQAAAAAKARLRHVIIAMAFVSLSLAAVFGRHGLLDVQRYRAERDRLKAEIADMERDQARLEAELAAIHANPAALERIAREELGLCREGEILVLLPPPAAR